jgi:hypothetical protein
LKVKTSDFFFAESTNVSINCFLVFFLLKLGDQAISIHLLSTFCVETHFSEREPVNIELAYNSFRKLNSFSLCYYICFLLSGRKTDLLFKIFTTKNWLESINIVKEIEWLKLIGLYKVYKAPFPCRESVASEKVQEKFP